MNNNILTICPNLKTIENTPLTASFLFRNKFASYLCELATSYEYTIKKYGCEDLSLTEALKNLFEFKTIYSVVGLVNEENHAALYAIVKKLRFDLLGFKNKNSPGFRVILTLCNFLDTWYFNFNVNLDCALSLDICEKFWKSKVEKKQKTKKHAKWIPTNEEVQAYIDEQVLFCDGVLLKRIFFTEMAAEKFDALVKISGPKFEAQFDKFYKSTIPSKRKKTSNEPASNPQGEEKLNIEIISFPEISQTEEPEISQTEEEIGLCPSLQKEQAQEHKLILHLLEEQKIKRETEEPVFEENEEEEEEDSDFEIEEELCEEKLKGIWRHYEKNEEPEISQTEEPEITLEQKQARYEVLKERENKTWKCLRSIFPFDTSTKIVQILAAIKKEPYKDTYYSFSEGLLSFIELVKIYSNIGFEDTPLWRILHSLIEEVGSAENLLKVDKLLIELSVEKNWKSDIYLTSLKKIHKIYESEFSEYYVLKEELHPEVKEEPVNPYYDIINNND